MAKGVVAGVVVLVGVVGLVMAGITGMGLFWIQRGRRLSSSDNPEASSRRL